MRALAESTVEAVHPMFSTQHCAQGGENPMVSSTHDRAASAPKSSSLVAQYVADLVSECRVECKIAMSFVFEHAPHDPAEEETATRHGKRILSIIKDVMFVLCGGGIHSS